MAAGLAAVEKLRAESPAVVESCSATAGLSLGEYCALVFAGALSFEDGLKVAEAFGVIWSLGCYIRSKLALAYLNNTQ